MTKFEELSASIIDEVCEVIHNNYDIKPKCITDDDSIENPALINDTKYYDLEAAIADEIEKLYKDI